MPKDRVLIPETPIVAATSFPSGLSAPRVAAAIARGLMTGDLGRGPVTGGLGRPELFSITPRVEGAQSVRELLNVLGFDARMRRARAVIIAEGGLQENAARGSLVGSATFEIATRARQAGVPAYAVLAIDALDSFDARMLDLQVVLEAGNTPALSAAGRELADLI